jgi:hypothetical protein
MNNAFNAEAQKILSIINNLEIEFETEFNRLSQEERDARMKFIQELRTAWLNAVLGGRSNSFCR